MKSALLALTMILLMTVGCGNASDPVTSFGDSSVTPSLSLPFSTAVSPSTFTPFSASHASFTWGFVTAPTPISIAAGKVVAVDTAANAASVTILHNARLFSKVSNLGSVSLRIGDVVSSGQAVGATIPNTSGTPQIDLVVFQDGVPVCPLSFLDAASRTRLIALGFQPCP